MVKFKLYICCLLFSLFASANIYSQKTSSWYDSAFVSIGVNQLLVYTAGKGNNSIVFESGLGVDGTTWFTNNIFKKLSSTNQVIAYNRAGYAPSTLGNEPRGLQSLANDLKEIIEKTAINNKVIIVGHSLGGSIARTFAIQNPSKVKALFLIDPNHEKYTAYANIKKEDLDGLITGLIETKAYGAAAEAKELINNISFLRSLAHLPDVPVIVLTSIRIEEGSTKEDVNDWAAAHALLGDGVKNFIHVKTDKSGHFIYEEEPKLFFKYMKKLMK